MIACTRVTIAPTSRVVALWLSGVALDQYGARYSVFRKRYLWMFKESDIKYRRRIHRIAGIPIAGVHNNPNIEVEQYV